MTTYTHPFCVYLTLWRGMFYIGSSSVEKVKKGYRGSVRAHEFREIWRRDLKENPTRFRTRIFKTCATRQEAYGMEEGLQKKLHVLNHPTVYVNRHIANEKFYCAGHSKETRKKMSTVRRGRKQCGGMLGVTQSEETRRKISSALRGKKKSVEAVRKASEGRCKPCSDGMNSFNSVKEMATTLSITSSQVSYRMRSLDWPEWNYLI